MFESHRPDHVPEGPTERHLVEEIAVIMWRKQRVLLAEAASYRAELQRRLEWDHRGLVRRATPHARAHPVLEGEVRSAVALSPGEGEAELVQLDADEACTRAAIGILEADGPQRPRAGPGRPDVGGPGGGARKRS